MKIYQDHLATVDLEQLNQAIVGSQSVLSALPNIGPLVDWRQKGDMGCEASIAAVVVVQPLRPGQNRQRCFHINSGSDFM